MRDPILFVRKIAHTIRKTVPGDVVTYDDLVSIGLVALCESKQRYDDSKGSFINFAYKRVKGSMIDEIRRIHGRKMNGKYPFRPRYIPYEDIDSLTDPNKLKHNHTVESDLTTNIFLNDLEDFLSPIEFAIIFLRFQGLLNSEIALQLGIHGSRVTQRMHDIRRKINYHMPDLEDSIK